MRSKVIVIGSVGSILLAVVGWACLQFSICRTWSASTLPLAAGMSLPAREARQEFSPFQQKILAELHRQTHANIRYDDGYYCGGEPPANIGVCTDVLLRAFRAAGVNLQQAVNNDIRVHLLSYPLAQADPNIDHRRCRNLVVFLRCQARTLPTSGANADWQPGDIVFWSTGNKTAVDHCGMVAAGRDPDGNYTVVHHWPGLPVQEIAGLYRFRVRYHFRWGTTEAGRQEQRKIEEGSSHEKAHRDTERELRQST